MRLPSLLFLFILRFLLVLCRAPFLQIGSMHVGYFGMFCECVSIVESPATKVTDQALPVEHGLCIVFDPLLGRHLCQHSLALLLDDRLYK